MPGFALPMSRRLQKVTTPWAGALWEEGTWTDLDESFEMVAQGDPGNGRMETLEMSAHGRLRVFPWKKSHMNI